MGNTFNPYNPQTVNRTRSGANYNNIGSTVTGYNVPTHRSTT